MSWYGRGRLDYHFLKFIELSFSVLPQEMILIRYAKLTVGLHLCRNHFAYSFGLLEISSRHFGLHDPSFFFCPHITVLIVRPFQYRLIHMDFFNESKNQI